MAQLDRFLTALTEYRAEALILEQDQAPSFRFLSGTKHVSKQVLDIHRILGLVSELSGEELVTDFRREGTASFVYKLGPTTYSGVLEEDSGTVVATIWEATKAMAEAQTPDEVEDGPVAISKAVPPVRAVDADPSEHHTVEVATQAASQPAPTPVDAEPPTSSPRPDSMSMPSLDRHGSDQIIPDDLPPNYRQQMDQLLRDMVAKGASDLHLCCTQHPVYRIDGHVEADVQFPVLATDEIFRMLFSITPQRNREEFLKNRDTDFAYAIEGVSRYRVNLFFDRHGPGAVFRAIPDTIIPADKLGLSDQVRQLADLNKGLVLVTGPTGSGKSTTLAGLVDLVNQRRKDHIITIEDPVEFVHENKSCLVNQREVGVHTNSFKAALRAALREDPDVILVGELRDLETMEIAIETAETGHLVFGTLHTTTAASTVDRIIDQFPADRQSQIRVMLSESLRAVISQTLLRKKSGGRVAAHEILLVTNSISNLIREGKTFQIESQMQTGRKFGMQTLNDHLVELVKNGTVEASEAYLKSVDKTALRDAFTRNGIRFES